MNRLDEIRTFLNAAEEDFKKFYEKANNAAGTRARKHMQELKKLASTIRSEIQTMKEANKGK
ncbi:MAG: histone H1 [Bacteroidota bacterium]